MLAVAFSSILAVTAVWAQQLDGYQIPFESLGLSSDCLVAVNTTVSSCPAWLGVITGLDPSIPLVPEAELNTLCSSTCRSDMAGLIPTIQAACTAPTDVMVPDTVTAYPAERYLYAIDISCLVDSKTGEYCDVLVSSWLNETNNNVSAYTSEQNCSYCELALLQYQLASPIGYDEESAEAFSSLTSSCAATTYTYSVPTMTTWALNATAVATTRPTCNATAYTVQEDDTCVSISGEQNVSTYGLITTNALTLACDPLPDVGTELCLSSMCTTYQLQGYDNCDSVVADLGITMAQLLAWNPNINSGCSNLAYFRGWYLASTTAAPVPTNAQPQSNTDCGQWYYVLPGDYCSLISVKFGISLSDFYFLNPQVDSSCDNLWAKTSDSSRNQFHPSSYIDFNYPPPYVGPTLNPTAPGTIEGCYYYWNTFVPGLFVQDDDDIDINSCLAWTWGAEVLLSDLLAWNPSLNASNCFMEQGYSYCVQKDEFPANITTANITYPYDYCFAPNISLIDSRSVQPDECDCYIQVREEDKGYFNCSMFPTLFNITVNDVVALNPQLTSNVACDSNLWNGLVGGYEQFCVERNTTGVSTGTSSSSTSTATSGQFSTTPMATITSTSVSTPSSTTAVVPPAQTEPGTTSSCTVYHVVVSGDTCYAISTTYKISLDEFYGWNPNVGTDCSALWLGYAVCVGV
ncbi:peptidoglycan-binding protein [Grosmannia clavigera kw1407]|uniref:Peptidoglycan-binding protein n=1 Tax=Grosmannia clavigera (strain kw1407 / UAMH 11150) TaxID=655863 RepID=F0X6K7_GROCL|nr:peptidoglycan-binding protein [Grosmannia clavigera kw1407]EFX06453.1 peptidoglycan-binding protein [Grosmannia clavigera kw1407]